MPFFTDLLRVAGAVAAPVLIATGVGTPLAVGIGALAAGGGNVAADAIERKAAEEQANEAAAQRKREADAQLAQQQQEAELKLARQKEEAEAAQAARRATLDHQLQQTELQNSVLAACQTDHLDVIPGLLQKMTDATFIALALTPLGACTSADSRQTVLGMLDAEKTRRGIP